MKEYTQNEIFYTWELAGSAGASFILYPEDKHSAKDIATAKAWLRDNHDVVSLKVADDDNRDYQYKSEIFTDARTRPLKWYQINQDEKLIRKERKAGTSPADFVTKYVLPFIKETEAMFFEKHGEQIYGL